MDQIVLDPKEGTRLLLLAAGIITVDEFMKFDHSPMGGEIALVLAGKSTDPDAMKYAKVARNWHDNCNISRCGGRGST